MDSEQDILAALWRQAKKPSRNAAMLTHNLAVTFTFLETQWDDKARQIVGALVAVNASRMHTTIWAALFQQLRETSSATVKLYVLKQFANICWTVPLTQGVNAFRTFASEIRPLLADIQIVTSNAFQKHFSTIICSLQPFVDNTLANVLFDTVYTGFVTWKRPDAIRAAAAVVVELVLRIPQLIAVTELLTRAKADADFTAYVVLLDTIVSAESTSSTAINSERVAFYCAELNAALLVIGESFSEQSKAVPPCVSAYRRLKSIVLNWEPAHSAAFTVSIMNSFETRTTSKLLLCPFLQFLQTTENDWWRQNSIVWDLVEDSDPFVRADALLALSSRTPVMGLPDVLLTIDQLREKLHFFIEENCSYSVVAALKFFRVLIVRLQSTPAKQKSHLLKLLHICSQHGKRFQGDVAAQIELLNTLAVASLAPGAIQQYVARVFLETPDREVAGKAFATLRRFSDSGRLNEQVTGFDAFESIDVFFQSASCPTYDENASDFSVSALPICRCEKLNALIQHRFLRLSLGNASEAVDTMIASEAFTQLCNALIHSNYVFQASCTSNLVIVAQLLNSHDLAASDVYVALVHAATACVVASSEREAEDQQIFLSLMQHSWSVLIYAAELLNAHFVHPTELSNYQFFFGDAISFRLRELIIKCRDVALSNEVPLQSSVFYEMLNSNICLFTQCVAQLAFSPLFMSELQNVAGTIVKCCETLLHFSPKYTWGLVTTVFTSFSQFRNLFEANTAVLDNTILAFARNCTPLVNRSITLDYVSYSSELCTFLLTVLEEDNSARDDLFSALLGENWKIVGDLVQLCSNDYVCFQNAAEGRVVCSILQLFCSLCLSKYRNRILSYVPREVIDGVAQSAAKWEPFAEDAECKALIAEIVAVYEASNNDVVYFLSSLLSRSTERSFLNIVESVANYWNVSSASEQASIVAYFSNNSTAENVVLLAVINNDFIPDAVEYVLTFSSETVVLETLLLLLTEAQSSTYRPLEFFIETAAYDASPAVLEKIILNYRWGWYFGPKTREFLERESGGCCHAFAERFVHRHFCGSAGSGGRYVDTTLYKSCGKSRKYFSLPQLPPGKCAFDFLFLSTANISSTFVAEDLVVSNSAHILQLLKRVYIKQDNYAGLSDAHVVLFLTRFISSMRNSVMFLWELDDWSSLLRAWVSVALTTPPQSEQWEWMQQSCWTLFYRFFDHLFSMAKSGHPKYPKESGAAYFEQMRSVYLQLSHSFLGCRVKSVDEVAVAALRYALRNDALFDNGRVDEEVFWCVTRTCLEALWGAISTEKVASLHDPEVVKMVCRVQGKIGWPVHIQAKIHAQFAPLLAGYGGHHEELEPDAQRHVLWCLGTFATKVYDCPESTMPTEELKALLELRSTVTRDLLKVARAVLVCSDTVSGGCVVDALELLRDVLCLNAASAVSIPTTGSASELEAAYDIARGFLFSSSPLSADAALHPASHCLLHLSSAFPNPRTVSTFCDEYVLSLASTMLSAALTAWLTRSTVLSAPPAQIACGLAIYLPYLMRLDCPLYVSALHCLARISRHSSSAEVEAVYKVMLTRLAEDLVDVRWNAPLSVCLDKLLVTLLSRIAPTVGEKNGVFVRRTWEGLWRGAGSPDVCHSHSVQEAAQVGLQHLVRGLAPGSPQWELSRLMVLSSASQPKGRAGNEKSPDVAQRRLSHTHRAQRVAASLEQSWWRSTMMATQAKVALHMAASLDADGCRALLFDFVKASDGLYEAGESAVRSAEEERHFCLLRERASAALLPPTEAVLAALNYFDFSYVARRRAVLHQLRAMVANDLLARPAPEMSAASWTGVYLDVLFERARCVDEGLWVACAVAAVEASDGRSPWVFPALESLIAASSTHWKRSFLKRIGKLAKRNGTQGRVRDFFAGACDRLAAARTSSAVWKAELLTEVTFVFTV